MSRRLILPAVAAMALALPAPASAIVSGQPAGDDDYPAQVFVGRDTNGDTETDERCVGTLVGSRQVLTAARCAIYGSVGVTPLPETGFEILVGHAQLASAVEYAVAEDGNEIHAGYLTVDRSQRPRDAHPRRPVDLTSRLYASSTTTEMAAWAPGHLAAGPRLGRVQRHRLRLRRAAHRRRHGPRRRGLSERQLRPAVMLCAAGTPAAGDENPCPSDSGSPLLLPDGTGFALAGVFSGEACATADAPGIFARVGADPLNAWVHQRTPEADFDLSHQPRAGEPVTLFSTSRHPEGAGYFTTFKWNFDGDDDFDDREGASITTTFPTPGDAVVGLEVSKPGGDTASVYYLFEVMPARRRGRRDDDTDDGRPGRPRIPSPAPRSPPSSPPAGRGSAAGASRSACGSRAPRPAGPP